MKRYYRMRPLTRQQLFWVRIFVFFAAMLGALIAMDMKVRPTVKTMAGYQVRVFATKAINDAIAAELEEAHVSYDTLVWVSRNSKGSVTDIQANVVSINRIQSNITNRVVQSLSEARQTGMEIPLGTLSGMQFFSGKGPKVNFRIIPSGMVETTLEHSFETAGINQVLHRIMLNVKVDISAVSTTYDIPTQVITGFCIAETVIVGDVPDAFTDVTGDNSSSLSKIFDHRAGQELYQ